MKTFKYTDRATGKIIPVALVKKTYLSGNLSITIFDLEKQEKRNSLTINLIEAFGFGDRETSSWVDTNNNGNEILDFIEDNKIGEATGAVYGYGHNSGCYREYIFNMKCLCSTQELKAYLENKNK